MEAQKKEEIMVYGNEINNKKGDVIFRFEFDDKDILSEKDMFYMMYRSGLFSVMASVRKFWNNTAYKKEILKRDKDVDKLYKKYKKGVN